MKVSPSPSIYAQESNLLKVWGAAAAAPPPTCQNRPSGLAAPGFGLDDHYRRTLNDKSSVGQIPLHLMNLSTVQYVLA